MAIHNTLQVMTTPPDLCLSLEGHLDPPPLPALPCGVRKGISCRPQREGPTHYARSKEMTPLAHDGQTQMKSAAVAVALESPGEDTEQPRAES